jgi:hypothetical protein
MIGISPLRTVITKGRTGPTRATYDWNVQQSTGQTANRWARRGASAWLNALVCQLVVGADITLTKLSIRVDTPLVTDSLTLVLQKNGVDTALSVTLAAGASFATGTGAVAVVKEDHLTVRGNQSGTELENNFWAYILASDT